MGFVWGYMFLGKRFEMCLVCRILHPGKLRTTVEEDLTFNTIGNNLKTKETYILKMEKACHRGGSHHSSLGKKT